MEVLKNYDWPGNIRELRNAVERAVILCDGELILREHLPPDMAGKGPERHTFRCPTGCTLDAVEKEYILGSLQRNGGQQGADRGDPRGEREDALQQAQPLRGRGPSGPAAAGTGGRGPPAAAARLEPASVQRSLLGENLSTPGQRQDVPPGIALTFPSERGTLRLLIWGSDSRVCLR